MTKIDIFSGFLGAGKTTLIKKLIADGYNGQRLVLIENEFGEIGIDGGFLQDVGIVVNEMNSGCICCSLTGDFRQALRMVTEKYAPERILIEPSGVGKLSEIVAAVQSAGMPDVELGGLTTVVDASKVKVYMKNFGEFFDNQICSAGCIILSRTDGMDAEKLAQAEALIRAKNPQAVLISTPWQALSGTQILAAIDRRDTITAELAALLEEHAREEAEDDDDGDECCCHHHDDDDDDDDEHEHEHGHHHHHHDDGDECCCHHHDDDDDDDDDDEHEHHHHHHDDGDECCCHHHDDDDDEHEHHHHHHHHHDADEVFQSWGVQTSKKFTADQIAEKLTALGDGEKYGFVVRAKGYVAAPDGSWVHFDYTPGEQNVRTGSANVSGRLCVIGAGLREDAVRGLFGL